MFQDYNGTLIVQDPFQHDFCVTKAYFSYAWVNNCIEASKITSKWFEQKNYTLEIFQFLPFCKVEMSNRKEKLYDIFEANLSKFEKQASPPVNGYITGRFRNNETRNHEHRSQGKILIFIQILGLLCPKNLTFPKAERDQRCPRLVAVVFYLFFSICQSDLLFAGVNHSNS